MQEESPEGGRFKKEVVVDGQSFLLLIRDEGGPPEIQVYINIKYETIVKIQCWTKWAENGEKSAIHTEFDFIFFFRKGRE